MMSLKKKCYLYNFLKNLKTRKIQKSVLWLALLKKKEKEKEKHKTSRLDPHANFQVRTDFKPWEVTLALIPSCR